MDTGSWSNLSFSPKGCRCPPTSCHDRCVFQSLSDYPGHHGDNSCDRHVDLYPLPTPNMAPQIQVQSSLHSLHIPVQQPLLRPIKDEVSYRSYAYVSDWKSDRPWETVLSSELFVGFLCCELGLHEIVCERDPHPAASEFDRAPQGQN